MATWLEDVLASLQGGGGTPPMFAPAASPFPDPIRQPTAEEEAAAAAAAREAAGQRMIRANQRHALPFGVPDAESAGIQLALEQAPAGTGVPVAPGATFAPFSIGGLPPSVAAAKEMAAPPPEPAPAPGPVPLPQPRPEMATDMSSQNRPAPTAPMAIAPAPVPAAEPGFMDRLKGFAPALMAAGAALQGDNSVAASMLDRQEKRQLLEQGQNATANALLQRGAPQAEVAAAIRNPELMKALITRYFETKPPVNVGGKLIRMRADGTPEVVYDDGTEKAPTQREIKLPDGSVQQQEWDRKAGTWKDVGKPAPGERDRRLSVTDITKLSEEGAKAQQVANFSTSFQPGYAGWKVNAVGELANTLGRNLPEGVVGEERAAASRWWQDYDRYKNQVRHGLYGASLTKNEQGAFLKADIHPGMDPKQIQANLETQRRLVENSIRRKGKALIGSTYDPKAISSAYGVQPEFFDQPEEAEPVRGRSGTITVGGQKLNWSLK